MAANPKRSRGSKAEPEIELRPDGWGRFERAVGAAVKSGPLHRKAAKTDALAKEKATTTAKTSRRGKK
jgi:hypothetical protein